LILVVIYAARGVTDAEGTSHLAPPESIGELRRQRLRWARLYFVCEARPHGNDPEALLNAAMAAGTWIVELRDREQPKSVIERSGRTFRRLANTYVALFIVNDDPYLAQDDMDPAEARRIMGPDAIIGLSTHSREQIAAAAGSPVDYISVGPIWETPTKEGRPGTGLGLVRAAAEIAQKPWFAIGGIDLDNVGQVVEAGAERICVVRAIRDASDPRVAATALFDAVDPAAREESAE
jgi:thiamine-phosphate pyrophosphorylase